MPLLIVTEEERKFTDKDCRTADVERVGAFGPGKTGQEGPACESPSWVFSLTSSVRNVATAEVCISWQMAREIWGEGKKVF